jgi:hypothetical protein
LRISKEKGENEMAKDKEKLLSDEAAEDFAREASEDPQAAYLRMHSLAAARAAGEQVRIAHPEIMNCRENALAIAEYAEEQGWPVNFESLDRAVKDLKSKNKLLLDDEFVSEAIPAGGTPRGSVHVSARPNASDAQFVNMTDVEFRRAIDYDMTAETYNRRRLDSPYFSERAEAVLSANPIGQVDRR